VYKGDREVEAAGESTNASPGKVEAGTGVGRKGNGGKRVAVKSKSDYIRKKT